MNATSEPLQVVVDTGVPYPAIASLEAADGQRHTVTVRWAEGKRRGHLDRVDLWPLIGTHRFYAPLRNNPTLFETVRLVENGHALAWGDDAIDMSAISVERLADEVMTGADFCAFLEKHSLTHQAAAAVLGRSKRQIEYYLKDEQIPRVVALACIGYEARRSSTTNTTPDSHAAAQVFVSSDVQASTWHNFQFYGGTLPSAGILNFLYHHGTQHIGPAEAPNFNLLNAKFERLAVRSTRAPGFGERTYLSHHTC